MRKFALVLIALLIISGCAAKAEESAVPSLTNTAASTVPIEIGVFSLAIVSTQISSEIKSTRVDEKTDNQFVVVKFSITNNDKVARDINADMFTLMDGDANKYKSSNITSSDEYLSNETLNPGLSRTRVVVFETPKKHDVYGLIVGGSIADGSGGTIIALKDIK